MSIPAKDITITVVMALLTAWWFRGMWRQYVRPSQEADFDQGMNHAFHVKAGGIALLGAWLAAWHIVWRTILFLFRG